MNAHINWLFRELPELVQDGLLDVQQAERIKSRYLSRPDGRSQEAGGVLLAVFGTIGALLCSLGVILLLAFNWDRLGIAARVVIAILPMLVAQYLGFLLLRGKDRSPAWRNATAAFWTLSCAGALALVSQTYHIEGSMEGFLAALIVCILPLPFITRCFTSDLLYLGSITVWSILVRANGGQAFLFWLLFAPFLVRFILTLKADRFGGSAVYLSWFAAVSLAVNTGFSLERVLPGLWIPVYAALFCLLYLSGALVYREDIPAGRQPLYLFGSWGIIALGALFTYSWPWKEIGWQYERESLASGTSVGDFLLLGILSAAVLGAAIILIRQKKAGHLVFGAFLPLSGLCFYLSASRGAGAMLVVHGLFNLYLLAMGLSRIAMGFGSRDLIQINSGTSILSLLIAMRFIFVEDFFSNLIWRGFIFIALGASFFAVNVWLVRRLKKVEPRESGA